MPRKHLRKQAVFKVDLKLAMVPISFLFHLSPTGRLGTAISAIRKLDGVHLLSQHSGGLPEV